MERCSSDKRVEEWERGGGGGGGGGHPGIKRRGNGCGEVGSQPCSAAWIIKEGFVLRIKEERRGGAERWRTWRRAHLSEQHPAGRKDSCEIC